MEWTNSDVPVGKRAIAWGASVVLGAAMYVVFGALLAAGPRSERAQVQGKIDAILAATLAVPEKVTKEELAIVQARSRATSSYLWDLHHRDEGLRREISSREAWAAVVGLVAGAGCFALCSVSWIKRDRAKDMLKSASQVAA